MCTALMPPTCAICCFNCCIQGLPQPVHVACIAWPTRCDSLGQRSCQQGTGVTRHMLLAGKAS